MNSLEAVAKMNEIQETYLKKNKVEIQWDIQRAEFRLRTSMAGKRCLTQTLPITWVFMEGLSRSGRWYQSSAPRGETTQNMDVLKIKTI